MNNSDSVFPIILAYYESSSNIWKLKTISLQPCAFNIWFRWKNLKGVLVHRIFNEKLRDFFSYYEWVQFPRFYRIHSFCWMEILRKGVSKLFELLEFFQFFMLEIVRILIITYLTKSLKTWTWMRILWLLLLSKF